MMELTLFRPDLIAGLTKKEEDLRAELNKKYKINETTKWFEDE